MSEPKTTMERLRTRAAERAELRDRIARMLYENGEMLADCEEGSMPTWDDLRQQDACDPTVMDHRARADAILGLDAGDCLDLARILLGVAATKFGALEDDLWAKVERAKGLEPGSLRGWPGVQQTVAL